MIRMLFPIVAVAMMAQVSEPFAGYIVDRHHALRPVFGIAGNFVLGDPIGSDVLTVASSGSVALAKTEDEVWIVRNGRITERKAAPKGTAVFTFDPAGAPHIAAFTDAAQQWRWTKHGIVEESLSQPDPIALRVELDEEPSRVERMGSSWYVAYCISGTFAVRITDGKVYRLPEPAE